MSSIFAELNKINDNESLKRNTNVTSINESTDYSKSQEAAYKKLYRAAEKAKLILKSDYVDYALEDNGEHVDEVIENEINYIGDVLKKEFPNLGFWEFLEDERFTSAIQVYTRPKDSHRFGDVIFEGTYEVVNDRLYPIDVKSV